MTEPAPEHGRYPCRLRAIGHLFEAEAESQESVRGTFNAAAIQGLQASGVAERTAKATEDTAKNTKKLVDKANAGGLTFA